MRTVVGVCVSLVMLAGTASAEPRCLTETEATAEKLQSLQSGLMVAALKCVHKPQLFVWERYQMFIDQFAPELQNASSQLQAWFDESYGPQGGQRYEAYVTGLANDYSLTTFGQDRFCESMSALALDVVNMSPAEIGAGSFETDSLELGKVDGCTFATLEDSGDVLGDSGALIEAVDEPGQPDEPNPSFAPELRDKPDVPEQVQVAERLAEEDPIPTAVEPESPAEGFSPETLADGERITIFDE